MMRKKKKDALLLTPAPLCDWAGRYELPRASHKLRRWCAAEVKRSCLSLQDELSSAQFYGRRLATECAPSGWVGLGARSGTVRPTPRGCSPAAARKTHPKTTYGYKPPTSFAGDALPK